MNFIKQKLIGLFLLFFLFISYYGCTTYDVAVQDGRIKGPPSRSSIKITENRDRNLEVHLSFSSNSQKLQKTNTGDHTNVNSSGIYEVEEVEGSNYKIERNGVNNFRFEGDNFRWTLPSYQGMLDFDLAVANNISLNGGIGLSEINGNLFWSKSLGLGFFAQGKNFAWRFDTGIKFNEMETDVDYVLMEDDNDFFPGTTRRVYFLNKEEKKEQHNMFFSFTINSAGYDWPINYFFSYNLSWQTFYDFKGSSVPGIETMEDVYYSESYHSLSAGIYKTILDMGRIIAGGRISAYTDEEGQIFIPDFFIQYDILLF